MSSALDRRSQRRQVLRVATGALLSAAVVLALYYVVPAPGSIVVGSVVCAVVFLGVVGFELRAVLGHPQPVARAAIAMAWVIPLFIVLFAWTYWAMSKSDLGTFSAAADQVRGALLHDHGRVDGRVRRHHPGHGPGAAGGLPADDLRPPGARHHREAHRRGGQVRSSSEDGRRGRSGGTVTASRLRLTRPQILAFRRRVGALDARLPRGRRSLRRAAWAGLQDSMPRAALLSIHARVEGTEPSTWEDPSLVQLWGPRYHAYVVAARDLAVFSLGRLPDDEPAAGGSRRTWPLGCTRSSTARQMTYGEAGRALGEHPEPAPVRRTDRHGPDAVGRRATADDLDRAAHPRSTRATPVSSSRAGSCMSSAPTTPEAFAQWAGIPTAAGIEAFDGLGRSR